MVPGSLQREEDYQNADDTSHNFADPSTLPAGQIYRLTPDPLPTALGLLDGSHMQAVLEARSDNVFYFPRVNEDHNEPPSFATVLTSGGTVGPFLMDLAANKVPLDDADGYAFGSEPRGWGRTIIRLDVRKSVYLPFHHVDECIVSFLDSATRYLRTVSLPNRRRRQDS